MPAISPWMAIPLLRLLPPCRTLQPRRSFLPLLLPVLQLRRAFPPPTTLKYQKLELIQLVYISWGWLLNLMRSVAQSLSKTSVKPSPLMTV